MRASSLATILTTAALASAAHAQVLYFDADHNSNTTLADGSPFVPNIVPAGGAPIANDNIWDQRTFANGGTIYTSNDRSVTGGEDCPMLRTRITGLTPGSQVYAFAYLWNDNGAGSWRLRAEASQTQPAPEIQGWNAQHFATSSFAPSTALGNGALVGPQPFLDLAYDAAGMETDGHFILPVMIQEGNRWLYEAPLGIHTVDAAGNLDIYIDDLANQNSNASRTWYDGVGIEQVPTAYGNGCGRAMTLGTPVAPVVDQPFQMDLAGAAPNSLAVAIAGLSNTTSNFGPLPFDLAPLGFAGCPLNASPDVVAFIPASATGDASFSFTVPRAFAGPVHLQWGAIVGNQLSVTPGTTANFHR